MASLISFWARSPLGSEFERRMAPHISALYRLACRLTNDPSDAEELVQDVLVKLYPKRDELAAIEQIRPWASRVLYRMFVDKWRRRRLEPINECELGEDRELDPESGQLSPEDYLQMRGDLGEVQEAMEQLSENHRTLLLLHDVEGYTLVELEDMLAVPLGTLKSRVHRARARLRNLLVEREPFVSGKRVGL